MMKLKYYIGELAEYFGVSTDTLRLYDRVGILPPHKDANGYRVYSREDMIFLSYVLRLRQFDLPLAEIAQLVKEGSLARADQALEAREAHFVEQIDYLENLLEVIRDYRAMFRVTMDNLGVFSVCESPRIILREMTDSFINTASAFDRLDTRLVRRFSSLVEGMRMLLPSPTFAELLYDPVQRKGCQRFAVCIVDRNNAVEIPEASRDLFTVIPPQKTVFTVAKCHEGLDYDHFITLHEYLVASKFTVTGDVLIVFVSVRNGENQSEDYYQVWVPVA